MPKRSRACPRKLDHTIRGHTVITREQLALFMYLLAQDNARLAAPAPAPVADTAPLCGEKVNLK